MIKPAIHPVIDACAWAELDSLSRFDPTTRIGGHLDACLWHEADITTDVRLSPKAGIEALAFCGQEVVARAMVPATESMPEVF
jgi:hypothetical protein